MIYSVVHLIVLQRVAWGMRTGYQKVISVSGIITSVLLLLNAMFE